MQVFFSERLVAQANINSHEAYAATSQWIDELNVHSDAHQKRIMIWLACLGGAVICLLVLLSLSVRQTV